MSNTTSETRIKLIKIASIIDECTIVINCGKDQGIKEGQRVLVYLYGDEIIDPDTGLSLGHLEIIKGTGRVTHVQELMATVRSDMKTTPSRSIRKIKSPSWGRVFTSTLGLEEEIEETLPASTVPFENPLVGDLVKLI